MNKIYRFSPNEEHLGTRFKSPINFLIAYLVLLNTALVKKVEFIQHEGSDYHFQERRYMS